MRRLAGLFVLALSLGLGSAPAATPSLFDPRVTVDLAETRLDAVLAELSRQTGLAFETPMRDLERRMQRQGEGEGRERPQPMPDLAAVRERANPLVTLRVVDAPVAEVLEDLGRQTGMEFRTADGQTWRLEMRRLGDRAEAADQPQVLAGDYLVALAALRLERFHDVVFGEPLLSRAQERLSLTLRVDAPSELARYAVVGLAPAAEAELDGHLLTPAGRVRRSGDAGPAFASRPAGPLATGWIRNS